MKFNELELKEDDLFIAPNKELWKVVNGTLMKQLPLNGGWVNVQQEELASMAKDCTWVAT